MLYGQPITWRAMQRGETNLENGGVVTVLAAATDILGNAGVSFSIGERVRVRFIVRATKGITAGDCTLQVLLTAGPAIIFWGFDGFPPRWRLNAVPAAAVWEISGEISGIVVASGTGTLHLQGTSAGSNSTIAADEAKFSYELLFG